MVRSLACSIYTYVKICAPGVKYGGYTWYVFLIHFKNQTARRLFWRRSIQYQKRQKKRRRYRWWLQRNSGALFAGCCSCSPWCIMHKRKIGPHYRHAAAPRANKPSQLLCKREPMQILTAERPASPEKRKITRGGKGTWRRKRSKAFREARRADAALNSSISSSISTSSSSFSSSSFAFCVWRGKI